MGETETWRKMCPKVILEGTRLTFKTEIAFQLNEHPRVVGTWNEPPRRLRIICTIPVPSGRTIDRLLIREVYG
jgi:hypothetical protein